MTNFETLDIAQVVYIHDEIVAAVGGRTGVRDFRLLHSALERCKATFLEQDLYPSLFDKAAALIHSMVMNHPFFDGNKRTGFAIMVRFLNSNGYKITASQQEIFRFGVAVDNDHLTLEEIKGWIETYTQINV